MNSPQEVPTAVPGQGAPLGALDPAAVANAVRRVVPGDRSRSAKFSSAI